MKRGKTEVETLQLNGWKVGDILEGVEFGRVGTILITGIGEEKFLSRWWYKSEGTWSDEAGSTTLNYRDWRKVGTIEEEEMFSWKGEKYENLGRGMCPGQHKFKLGQEVYCDRFDQFGRNTKYIICGLLSAPAYSYHYTLVQKDGVGKKYYCWEENLDTVPVIRTRKELYKELGTDATKIVRRLRDKGDIDINLPPNDWEC